MPVSIFKFVSYIFIATIIFIIYQWCVYLLIHFLVDTQMSEKLQIEPRSWCPQINRLSDQQPKIKAYSIYTDIKQTVLPFKEAETTEYLAILLDKL